jgi:hypothetical protein
VCILSFLQTGCFGELTGRLFWALHCTALHCRQLIVEPYRSGSAEGHSRLAALVKPIMWRNSKAVAAQDHPLPRRVLQVGARRGPRMSVGTPQSSTPY